VGLLGSTSYAFLQAGDSFGVSAFPKIQRSEHGLRRSKIGLAGGQSLQLREGFVCLSGFEELLDGGKPAYAWAELLGGHGGSYEHDGRENGHEGEACAA
jgi:hypothetical protein